MTTLLPRRPNSPISKNSGEIWFNNDYRSVNANSYFNNSSQYNNLNECDSSYYQPTHDLFFTNYQQNSNDRKHLPNPSFDQQTQLNPNSRKSRELMTNTNQTGSQKRSNVLTSPRTSTDLFNNFNYQQQNTNLKNQNQYNCPNNNYNNMYYQQQYPQYLNPFNTNQFIPNQPNQNNFNQDLFSQPLNQFTNSNIQNQNDNEILKSYGCDLSKIKMKRPSLVEEIDDKALVTITTIKTPRNSSFNTSNTFSSNRNSSSDNHHRSSTESRSSSGENTKLSDKQIKLIDKIESLYSSEEITIEQKNTLQALVHSDYKKVKKAYSYYKNGDPSLFTEICHSDVQISLKTDNTDKYGLPNTYASNVPEITCFYEGEIAPDIFRYEGILTGKIYKRTTSLKIFKKWNTLIYCVYPSRIYLYKNIDDWYNEGFIYEELFFKHNQRVGPILQQKYIDGEVYTFKLEEVIDEISESLPGVVSKRKKLVAKFGFDESLSLRYLRDEIISRINVKKIEYNNLLMKNNKH